MVPSPQVTAGHSLVEVPAVAVHQKFPQKSFVNEITGNGEDV